LSLFTINGLPDMDVALSDEPTAVTVWDSPKDFDSVAVGWKSSLVMINRASEFTLQKSAVTFRRDPRIIAPAFDPEVRAIVTVIADGTLF
jgi:hypothetical protein